MRYEQERAFASPDKILIIHVPILRTANRWTSGLNCSLQLDLLRGKPVSMCIW